jgi:RecB family endonuclease NucS
MSVTTLHRPTHRETLHQLEAAFDRGDLVAVFGRCAVEYEGRAASSLGPGDRLLLLKPDGSALVHTEEGRTPVNWQPPGCDHRASVRDGRLRVVSTRENPDERLAVGFDAVDQFVAYAAADGAELDLRGSEEDLRRHVLEDPSVVEAGFEPTATERETAAGPVDVFGRDADGRPTVLELKRRRVGPAAAGQLGRYVEAVEREVGDGAEVRGVLVAPSVTDRAATMLADRGLEFVGVDFDSPGGERGEASADGGEGADGTGAGADDDAGGADGTDAVDGAASTDG